jgi:HK97 gp10 family phage protein
MFAPGASSSRSCALGRRAMSDGITVKVDLARFKRDIGEVRSKVEKIVVRQALRAGARVFRDSARSGAPRLRKADPRRVPGALARAVVIFRPRSQGRGSITYTVGVRASKSQKAKGNDPFYWRFLEAGWMPRGPGQKLRGGSRRKSLERSRARSGGASFVKFPFLDPAFKNSGGAALAAFTDTFNRYMAVVNKNTP